MDSGGWVWQEISSSRGLRLQCFMHSTGVLQIRKALHGGEVAKAPFLKLSSRIPWVSMSSMA